MVWSAPGSWPECEDQLGLRLPFVSSPTFEFGLEIETANEHGWGGRAHGSAGKALLLRQGNSMGSSTGFEHKGHCSTE